MWRTLARSKTLKAGAFVWRGLGRVMQARGFGLCDGHTQVCRALAQRHEGKGTGDGVRLREGKKALKGKPQERIRSETVAGRLEAEEGVRRLGKPGDAVWPKRGNLGRVAAALSGETL